MPYLPTSAIDSRLPGAMPLAVLADAVNGAFSPFNDLCLSGEPIVADQALSFNVPVLDSALRALFWFFQ